MRQAGILLHPTSFPGRFSIGDLGPGAERFMEWAETAGIRLWQVLPLGPTGFGNSPYGGLSAFAGNPILISPERLVTDGFLARDELDGMEALPADHVDFGSAIEWKQGILRKSWRHFSRGGGAEQQRDFLSFQRSPDQAGWLEEWAVFMAVKDKYDDADWLSWPAALAAHKPAAVATAARDLSQEVSYHKYLQFLFFRQWNHLRDIARSRGIHIMGDVPIYVAYDSSDVWSNVPLFMLDEQRKPVAVAGVPPDYFSADGQRWGNPLYRWDRMAEQGYDWWIGRLKANLRLADVVRLDHFRGFAAYWQIPADKPAPDGKWVKGPGVALFTAIREALGELPVVAEDLGLITPDVDELRKAIGVSGMKVLQFGFGDLDNIHLPHNFVSQTVVYTGTHDNDTTAGWLDTLSEKERRLVGDYLGARNTATGENTNTMAEDIHWQMIRLAFNSVAELAIVPMQDVLGLGKEARMNTPGKSDGNWLWRARAEHFSEKTARHLRRLVEISGRLLKA